MDITQNPSPEEGQTMTTTQTIREIQASEPGALAGFEITCTCGDRQTTSMASNAPMLAEAHQAWHEAERERRPAICPKCGCADQPGAHAAGCQDGRGWWTR